MLRFVIGFNFRHKVKTSSSVMVIKGDTYKLVLDHVVQQNGEYYITYASQETQIWTTGKYQYQVLNVNGIEQYGEIILLKNYLLVDEVQTVKSKNQILLQAIEAQIAGKASSMQSSMHVGDKSIGYCSIDELFKLRQYFRKLVAQQKDEEQGTKTYVQGNQGKIKYKWSIR